MIIRLFFTTLLALYSFNIFAIELGQLTPQELETLREKKPLIIDIRTAKEWKATGIIPNSQKLQSFDEQGNFNKDKWLAELKKLQKNDKQTIVLVCRSGHRSDLVGKMLTEKLGMKNIYHLSNGILEWVKSGHKTTETCQPNQTC